MSCGDVTERQPFQDLLAELNPRMPESVRSVVQLLASADLWHLRIYGAMY
jgi:hypothetical protein